MTDKAVTLVQRHYAQSTSLTIRTLNNDSK